MKTTLWTGLVFGVALLIAGCGKAQMDQPNPPATEPRAETPTPHESVPQVPAEPRSTEEASSVPESSNHADRHPAEGAGIAGKKGRSTSVEQAEAGESMADRPAAESDKPTVLKAVSRALFKAFTSDSDRTPPAHAPGFRPNR